MIRVLRPWVPALLWAGVILFFTSQPSLGIDLGGGRDKLGHLAAYFVLGVLLLGGSRSAGSAPRWALLAGGLFAVADEVHQAWIPGRYPEWRDGVADLLGLSAGAWVYERFGRIDSFDA